MNEQSALAKAVRDHAHYWPCVDACDELLLSGEALEQLRALVDVSDAAKLASLVAYREWMSRREDA